DRQIPIFTERGARLRAARPVHPGPNNITRRQPGAGSIGRHLAIVEEDLPAFERRRGAHARSNAIGAGEKLVEPNAGLARGDRPVRHTDWSLPSLELTPWSSIVARPPSFGYQLKGIAEPRTPVAERGPGQNT